MGTKWPVTKRHLYGYWAKLVTKELNNTLKKMGTDTLINLASKEYFKVVDKNTFKGKIINIEFKEKRAGGYSTISIFAKLARGSMCRYAFKNKVRYPEELMGFNSGGYLFSHDLSNENKYVFIRG